MKILAGGQFHSRKASNAAARSHQRGWWRYQAKKASWTVLVPPTMPSKPSMKL